jgi:deoxyribodipyrimidine photo-lyase
MQKKQRKTSLVWFTNNLRVKDNEALKKAIRDSEYVIAVYCFDPKHYLENNYGFKKTESYRAQFLIETVTELKQNLEAKNITLLVEHKPTEQYLLDIYKIYSFDAVYFQKEWTQEEQDTLKLVKKNLPDSINYCSYYDQFLYHPEDIPMDISNIPKVFTDFRKQLEKQSSVRSTINSSIALPEKNLIKNTTKIPSLKDLGLKPFTTHPNSAFPFKGGEKEALNRLNSYIFKTKQLGVYKKTRNGLIGESFSSKFSAWLANGSISARTIYWSVKEFELQEYKNDSTYWLIFELIWRDFFKFVSLKHGNNIFKIGGVLQKDYSWQTRQEDVNKWINGQTKEPFVNANMIELRKTGFMSNRGRQNVASYFAKSLELDWRIGASYFESLLIDYDVHSNYGNWLYVAGVGNDPRDRKFNVKLQAERYDAQGKYQRLWLQDTLF